MHDTFIGSEPASLTVGTQFVVEAARVGSHVGEVFAKVGKRKSRADKVVILLRGGFISE